MYSLPIGAPALESTAPPAAGTPIPLSRRPSGLLRRHGDPPTAATRRRAGAALSDDAADLTQTIVLKAGNAFLVSHRDGRMPISSGHPLGLYRNDGRFLCGHE